MTTSSSLPPGFNDATALEVPIEGPRRWTGRKSVLASVVLAIESSVELRNYEPTLIDRARMGLTDIGVPPVQPQ